MNEEETKLSEDAKRYIRSNKKLLIEKFANLENFPSDSQPVSVFMAGSPGAGKTEFSKRLISTLGDDTVRIDADEIRSLIPQYIGSNSYVVQEACTIGVNKIHDFCLDHNQSLILDGTFSIFEIANTNVSRSISRNRLVTIYYLFQDPLVAWEYTKKREALERRNVPKEVFVNALFGAIVNVNKIKHIYEKAVELNVVIKGKDYTLDKFELNVDNVEPYIKLSYNKEELVNLLN
jgi:adenylylsulfate kinase-like enzyme